MAVSPLIVYYQVWRHNLIIYYSAFQKHAQWFISLCPIQLDRPNSATASVYCSKYSGQVAARPPCCVWVITDQLEIIKIRGDFYWSPLGKFNFDSSLRLDRLSLNLTIRRFSFIQVVVVHQGVDSGTTGPWPLESHNKTKILKNIELNIYCGMFWWANINISIKGKLQKIKKW